VYVRYSPGILGTKGSAGLKINQRKSKWRAAESAMDRAERQGFPSCTRLRAERPI
jgi:hypothetical protein